MALSEAQLAEWTVQTTIAIIAGGALIIVAMINTRRNRKTTEDLSKQVGRVDTHATHIDSLENRTEKNTFYILRVVGAVAVLVVWLIVSTIRGLIDQAKSED